jgi:hypothetical protein
MDQISLLFAVMLASVSQLPTHLSVPAASAPPPTVTAQVVKKPAPPLSHVALKSEHACSNFGQPDAVGNLNYFCH